VFQCHICGFRELSFCIRVVDLIMSAGVIL
jgi:hypothetical protein